MSATGLLGGGNVPTAVLADDERLMRDQLRSRLREAWPDLEILGEARNGAEAVDLVERLRPDVVFLDIRMPGVTGLEAARQIAQLAPCAGSGEERLGGDLPEIVFITAYDQHAVEAFERGACDYVLKPADPARLATTVIRLRERLSWRCAPSLDGGELAVPKQAASLQRVLHSTLGFPGAADQIVPGPGARRQHLRWIQAGVGTAIQMVPIEDVLFFISDEKYTRVQTLKSESLIRKPIKELVDELDPELFWQIHRSTLVNVNAIAQIQRDDRGRQIVSVKGHPEQLEVSRSYIGLFKGM